MRKSRMNTAYLRIISSPATAHQHSITFSASPARLVSL
jgi:hypothetical protein